MPKVGKWFSVLIGDAVSIAVVSYAIEVSVAKHFARVYGYEIDANQVHKDSYFCFNLQRV